MKRRLLAIVGLAMLAAMWPTAGAQAHPLGNFTVNRYSGVHVSPREIRIDYVVDLAEIPTFQEKAAIDTDGDDAGSLAELDRWARETAPDLAAGIEITIDGGQRQLQVRGAKAQLLPGQGDLDTLRFEGDFVVPDPGSAGTLVLADTNDPDRIGWREITVSGQDGAAVSGSDVPADSVSDALRSYPQDLLASPLDVRSATTSFAPGALDASAATGTLEAETTSASRPGVDGGPFANLLANQGAALIVLGLVLAVAFGAWHALLPGHGKTLMAAYMVGSKAATRQAISVGSAVAIMHTVSVVGLGLLVLSLERTFRPEAVYPWLGVASGLVALGLGAYLLISRLSAWSARTRPAATHDGLPPGHDHAHPSGLEHDHGFGPHAHALPDGAPLSPKGLLALALAGGILPAPSALLVMLGAINAHRVGYGLALVAAFSAGLAAALIVIGMGALRARDAMARRLSTAAGRMIPVLSAAAIVAVGAFLTVRGFTQV